MAVMFTLRSLKLILFALQMRFTLYLGLAFSPNGLIRITPERHIPLGTSNTQISAGATSESLSLFPEGTIGPPPLLKALSIGEHVKASRRHTYRRDAPAQTTEFTIERVSSSPDIFVLRDFLSNEECDEIVKVASEMTMSPAETVTGGDTNSRKKCDVAWIPSGPNGFPLVSSLIQPIAHYFLSEHFVADPGAGVEDLQVLKYEQGGEFVLHHDGEPRILTVIYYVNGVGGTWFPLAHTSENNDENLLAFKDQSEMNEAFEKARKNSSPRNRAQALKLSGDLEPGKDGLLVKGGKGVTTSDESNSNTAWIKKGDAVAFYSYMDDGSERFDWRALHTGLPADEVKWIANHWFRSNTLIRELELSD